MVAGSICFRLYRGSKLTGFGRAVTDGATFTWVADIVIEPEFRGAGLGLRIMECLVFMHPIYLWSDTEHVRTLLREFRISVCPREITFDSWAHQTQVVH